ncbi:MAG: septum formation initiator family protein [Pseudomonadota bacterium]
MWTRHRKPSKLRKAIVPTLCVLAMGYFVYHGFHGTHGIKSNAEYMERIAILEAELAQLNDVADRIGKRTSLLRNGSIEQDMLDEQARRMLGFSAENEIIIRLP